jgi:hypothetical protein
VRSYPKIRAFFQGQPFPKSRSATLAPGPQATEPAYVALVNRGTELAGTRTRLTALTMTISDGVATWDAADLSIPDVWGRFDSLRFFNRDGRLIGDKWYGRQPNPRGGVVTIMWAAEGVLVNDVS